MNNRSVMDSIAQSIAATTNRLQTALASLETAETATKCEYTKFEPNAQINRQKTVTIRRKGEEIYTYQA